MTICSVVGLKYVRMAMRAWDDCNYLCVYMDDHLWVYGCGRNAPGIFLRRLAGSAFSVRSYLRILPA